MFLDTTGFILLLRVLSFFQNSQRFGEDFDQFFFSHRFQQIVQPPGYKYSFYFIKIIISADRDRHDIRILFLKSLQ